MGCGPVGGQPTFELYGQPGGFSGTIPYYQMPMMAYPQPAYQPPPRTAITQPRQQPVVPKPAIQSKPSTPAVPETRMEVLPVEVPSPQQLGIRLEEPGVAPVIVPDPHKLGIRIE